MQNAYVLTGNFKSPNLIELDEAIQLSLMKVRVIIEPIEETFSKENFISFFKDLESRQKKRNFSPVSKEEMDNYINEIRDDWN